jgi:hypothetical protein
LLLEDIMVHGKRRLGGDATLSVAGSEFETTASFLAGRNVTVARSLLDCAELPWIEHEDQRHVLTHIAPRTNAQQRRPRLRRGIDAIPFDPPGVLLAQATGKQSKPVQP